MENQIVESCGWCRVRTALDEVARAKVDEYVDDDYGPVETRSWVIYRCVSCSRPTVREEWYHEPSEEVAITTLLPSSDRDDSALPVRVSKAYEAAQAVRHVEPNAFAVLIGRLLEVICLEEGATGKNLIEKLSSLAASGRIPGPLADMSQKLREIRNLGAHASAADEVRQGDVPVIQEFAEAILEYLYRAPAKVAAVEARLKKNPRPPSTSGL